MRMQKPSNFVRRLLPLAALWWLFAGSDGFSWLLGGPVIVVVAAWRLGEAVKGKARLRPWQLVLFVPYFARRSLIGSCDVAWRAMHHRLPIAPVVRAYVPRLPAASPARVFFANSINLLPGTLTASWNDDGLHVHVLTDDPQTMAELRKLEYRVAMLFGHPWTPPEEDAGA